MKDYGKKLKDHEKNKNIMKKEKDHENRKIMKKEKDHENRKIMKKEKDHKKSGHAHTLCLACVLLDDVKKYEKRGRSRKILDVDPRRDDDASPMSS